MTIRPTSHAMGSERPGLASSSHQAPQNVTVAGLPSEATTAASSEDLAVFVHEYLREQIALADQKAAFTLTISAALLAYLKERGVTESLHSPPLTLPAVLGLAAFAILGLTALTAAAVVAPRTKIRSSNGIIFWDDILQHKNANDYVTAVDQLPDVSGRTEVLRHAYVLATINHQKYSLLRWALFLGATGLVATVGFLLAA